jgi:hypothetical protein
MLKMRAVQVPRPNGPFEIVERSQDGVSNDWDGIAGWRSTPRILFLLACSLVYAR